MSGPHFWLCLFTFRPIASKQLNGLTTIDTVSWLSGPVVTHPLWVQEVPGSIPVSGKGFYVWFVVLSLLCFYFFFVPKHIIWDLLFCFGKHVWVTFVLCCCGFFLMHKRGFFFAVNIWDNLSKREWFKKVRCIQILYNLHV